MKYILLHNIEQLTKEKILEGYLKKGFHVQFENENDILLKYGDKQIIDEDTYIKITIQFLKRNSMILESQGKIIDLTEAFEYAYSKNGYEMIGNRFDWYLRNIILKEILKENEESMKND